jgi:RNA polymerase sigma-70 factor, ECF subfamily
VRGLLEDLGAIRICREGDASAYRTLVERYQSEAMGHAFAILGNRQDAEDAVQDAFLKAYRALDTFDETRRFYPWFYTILRNCCFATIARRRACETESSGRELVFLADPTAHEPAETLRLEAALRAIPPESREIITLRHFDGLSYAELSQRLGIPAGTVMSRLFYARKQLRVELGGRP